MSKLSKFFKGLFKNQEDDGFEEARMSAALECLKHGKPISGKIYDDGTVELDNASQ